MSQQASSTFIGNFANNLFGAIAGGSNLLSRITPGTDFIPLDSSGKTLSISSKGMVAQWLGLKTPLMQKYAYEYCYSVAAVCDRLAEADTTGKLEIIRAKGKGKDDFATNGWALAMNKVLAQPNPMQTWEQFRGQQTVYKKVFGYCPVFPIMASGFENMPEQASAIINIPPWCFEPVSTLKLLYQTRLKDIVREYKVSLFGTSFTLQADQIFILTDSFMQDERKDFLVPMSRLSGLDMAVSNLCAAMEADNIMLRRAGPAAILSPGTKDGLGTVPSMSEDERTEVQQDLARYGVTWSQFQYMISRNPLQLQTVGFNAKQLGSKDTIRASEEAICQRYNYSYVLYKDSEATYANQSGAHKGFYQNNVIPNSLKDMNEYNKFFKAQEAGCIITMNYSHLPILQENEKEKADASKAWNEALKIAYDNNLITRNQWLAQMGFDSIPDGDLLKGDNANTDPLAIRLGVGGTQSMMDLLANTTIGEKEKINALQLLFGLSPADAASLVTKPTENGQTQEGQAGPQGNQGGGQGEAAPVGSATTS